MAKPGISQSAAARLADQLQRAFYGSAWHGPALMELLAGVPAAAAAARPLPEAHSIWELVLHIEAWDRVGLKRLQGKKALLRAQQNFPPVPAPTEAAWRRTLESMEQTHQQLVATVARLSDSRLGDRVPGKAYDFYHLLHGIAQHELYHAGQIAILKKRKKK
jgi:uncharacterized damage-inducible protein DinB